MPWRRLYALACLMAWNALKFFMSSVITMARCLFSARLMGMTCPASWVAIAISSAVASPFFGFLTLYLKVGHCTIGRSFCTGRGATRAALAILFCLLLNFLAGWLNQVFTYLCQSLWKCPLGTN